MALTRRTGWLPSLNGFPASWSRGVLPVSERRLCGRGRALPGRHRRCCTSLWCACVPCIACSTQAVLVCSPSRQALSSPACCDHTTQLSVFSQGAECVFVLATSCGRRPRHPEVLTGRLTSWADSLLPVGCGQCGARQLGLQSVLSRMLRVSTGAERCDAATTSRAHNIS